MGEGQSKESVDEGSAGANAKKEKALGGLCNPGSRAFKINPCRLIRQHHMKLLVFCWGALRDVVASEKGLSADCDETTSREMTDKNDQN